MELQLKFQTPALKFWLWIHHQTVFGLSSRTIWSIGIEN